MLRACESINYRDGDWLGPHVRQDMVDPHGVLPDDKSGERFWSNCSRLRELPFCRNGSERGEEGTITCSPLSVCWCGVGPTQTLRGSCCSLQCAL